MDIYDINSILVYSDKIYNEIFNAEVLLNATICCCRQKEYSGEYYGIPQDFVQNVSNERNEYLSLLSLLSDKIHHISKLNSYIENKLTLNKNANYCCRKITAQSSDYQSS